LSLKRVQENWKKLGERDPLWAVISWPEKKGNKWDIHDFFQYGRNEIDETIKYAKGIGLKNFRVALDFGCGVGRLSQALSIWFDEVYGIDISSSMIQAANTFNVFDKKCHYILNNKPNLELFSDNYFDFIYSNITLQHMKPIFSIKYIKEFIRVLVPDGLLIFQVPSHRRFTLRSDNPLKKTMHYIKYFFPIPLVNLMKNITTSLGRGPVMEFYAIKNKEVEKLISQSGGKLIDKYLYPDNECGWYDYRYTVTK
jgi:ubiquinone/menaquinone biosynthesis C-methylase UbiE